MEIERKKLNKAESMVLEDIIGHPGTSFSDIERRCAHTYRRSYLQSTLTHLIAIGYVKNDRERNRTSLYAVNDAKI